MATLSLVVPLGPGWTWAQQPHGPDCEDRPRQAELFAPALADSGRIYRGAIAPTRREFYFFKKVSADPASEDYRIFVSRLQGDTWSPPELLKLGGEYSDLYPVLSPDGSRLVFTSYRPIPGDTAPHPSANLWYSDRRGAGWDTPVPIRAANALGSYHSQPVFWGRSLVFRRTSADWRTSETLVTRWDGRAYRPPESFAPVQRWADWRTDLRVWGGIPGPDGASVLLEVSRLDPRTGQPLPSDLWVSMRTGVRWTTPRPLGAGVNTEAYTENFPMVSSDGCEMTFVRDFSRFYRVPLPGALAATE
jgi:hypothetical protein